MGKKLVADLSQMLPEDDDANFIAEYEALSSSIQVSGENNPSNSSGESYFLVCSEGFTYVTPDKAQAIAMVSQRGADKALLSKGGNPTNQALWKEGTYMLIKGKIVQPKIVSAIDMD